MTNTPETPMDAARRLAAGALRNGEALHTYSDLDANPLYWRIRAKHPASRKKWIRPMHLTGNGYELREPERPANGKPLYRLHELATDRISNRMSPNIAPQTVLKKRVFPELIV
jgi:hypothetical protein